MKQSPARAWLDIELGALQRNGAALARRSGARLLPMIKADAYGLGAAAAVRALEPLDPWGFGVATVVEGEELRGLGVVRPVVVFTPLLPLELERARQARLTPTLGFAAEIEAWAAAGGGPWHLAIDTGMSRAGIPWREAGTIRDLVAAHRPEGAFTHFHSAELDGGSVAEQERRFEAALADIGKPDILVHTENSAASARAGKSRWDLLRPGIFLYGVGSGPSAAVQPEPVVHFRARIVEVRKLRDGDTVSYNATFRASGDMRIATLAAGYADGYPRALSGRGSAIVRGRTVPVAGRVTMDMIMLDVTAVECGTGDIATLLGVADGALLSVEQVAGRAEMSPYELLTGLRSRIERVYAEAPT